MRRHKDAKTMGGIECNDRALHGSHTFDAGRPEDQTVAEAKSKKQKAIARLTAFQWQPITAPPHTFGGTKILRRSTEGFYDTALNEASNA